MIVNVVQMKRLESRCKAHFSSAVTPAKAFDAEEAYVYNDIGTEERKP
jgi:hypothetical protein